MKKFLIIFTMVSFGAASAFAAGNTGSVGEIKPGDSKCPMELTSTDTAGAKRLEKDKAEETATPPKSTGGDTRSAPKAP